MRISTTTAKQRDRNKTQSGISLMRKYSSLLCGNRLEASSKEQWIANLSGGEENQLNTKQIAEEAAKEIWNYKYNGNSKTAQIIRSEKIIEAAIEKATDVEQLRAERDHYKMLTQELGQELRAAHASELPANPDKDHPERLAPAGETS